MAPRRGARARLLHGRPTLEMGKPLFAPWTNTAMKLAVAVMIAAVMGGIVGLMVYVRTPYITEQHRPVDQPVVFDHRHHVFDDEIDCLYCHSGAETSPSAGIPATEVCMGCHAQIWNDSPLLEPVRRSYFSGKPIPYNRVHDLPDFVFFDHSVHVRGDVACEHCHGRVDRMAMVHQVAPLTMTWCLDCHRNPEATLSAPPTLDADHRTTWGATTENLVPTLQGERAITNLTTCTACHR